MGGWVGWWVLRLKTGLGGAVGRCACGWVGEREIEKGAHGVSDPATPHRRGKKGIDCFTTTNQRNQ